MDAASIFDKESALSLSVALLIKKAIKTKTVKELRRSNREYQKMDFQAVSSRTGKVVDATKFPDVKAWVVDAIIGESQRPERRLWRDEPDAETAKSLRLTQIRRLKRHSQNVASVVLKRLAYCTEENRCFSAGCPECARLFQRAFVRGVRRYFRKNIPKGYKLIAISLVPAEARIPPADLGSGLIDHSQKMTAAAMQIADIKV